VALVHVVSSSVPEDKMKIKMIIFLSAFIGLTPFVRAADEGQDKEFIEADMRTEGAINVYDACAEELAALRVDEPSLTMADAVTTGLLPEQCKDSDKCMYNDPKNPTYDPKGNGQKKKTIDHCIWPQTGNLCHANTCCDFKNGSVAADGTKDTTKCDCNKDARGRCKKWEDCARCMCMAESESENDGCKLMTVCALYNRGKAHKEKDPNGQNKSPQEYICDAAVYQGGDAAQFSSAKCICDEAQNDKDKRGGDNYNQKYCQCCAGTVSAASGCQKAIQDLDKKCKSKPYSQVNSFRTKNLADPQGCETVNPPNQNCKHKYFNCAYKPKSNPVTGG
jgi:hypothetical protein